jgi:adenylyl- and sulfurtransferase ThiI
LIFVHFHSVPYLDKTSQEKVRTLVSALTRHQYLSRLYLVPFGEIQRQIVTAVARPLRVVLYRRMMLRIAEALARTAKAKALVTGESLAQVASQTLDNMAVIQQASTCQSCDPLSAWISKRLSTRPAALARSIFRRSRTKTVASFSCPNTRQRRRERGKLRRRKQASMCRKWCAVALKARQWRNLISLLNDTPAHFALNVVLDSLQTRREE